jgi:hypothetical protein
MSRARRFTGRSREWPEERDAFDEFHGTAVDDQIDLQERKNNVGPLRTASRATLENANLAPTSKRPLPFRKAR